MRWRPRRCPGRRVTGRVRRLSATSWGISFGRLGNALGGPPHALDVACGLAAGIVGDQRRVGERIQRELEAVAVQAHAPDHLFVRAQVPVLVVLYSNTGNVALLVDLARQMA